MARDEDEEIYGGFQEGEDEDWLMVWHWLVGRGWRGSVSEVTGEPEPDAESSDRVLIVMLLLVFIFITQVDRMAGDALISLVN